MKTKFTPEIVNELNTRQMSGSTHPYTCCGGDENTPSCKRRDSSNRRYQGEIIPYTSENEGVLIATENGWICPCGQYKQNWYHG